MGALDTDPTGRVLNRLRGLEASYDCPDKESIEAYIRANRERITKAAEHAPRTVIRLHRDNDLLLERWLWLHETG